MERLEDPSGSDTGEPVAQRPAPKHPRSIVSMHPKPSTRLRRNPAQGAVEYTCSSTLPGRGLLWSQRQRSNADHIVVTISDVDLPAAVDSDALRVIEPRCPIQAIITAQRTGNATNRPHFAIR